MLKKITKSNQFFVLFWKEIQVVIECNEESLIEDCARLMALSSHKATQSPSQLIYDIKITYDNARFTLEFTDWPIKVFTHREDLILYCTLTIGAAFLRKTETLVLHAGSFILEGQAIVFGGASRVGKSTLAYEALKEGLPILGDDMITFNTLSHEVEAFPKPFKLRISQDENISIIDEYFFRGEHIQGNLGGEERVLLSRGSAGMLPLEKPFPIGAFVLLKRNATHDKTTIEKLTGLEAISAGLNQLITIKGGSGLSILKPLQYLSQNQKIYQLNIANLDSKNGLKLLIAHLKK